MNHIIHFLLIKLDLSPSKHPTKYTKSTSRYYTLIIFFSLIGIRSFPGGIELVFHTESSMKYRSLHTILKYRYNIPNLIFHAQNIGISYRNGMLKQYLRIVCKDGYFILFSV
jgi:hypothetical protein